MSLTTECGFMGSPVTGDVLLSVNAGSNVKAALEAATVLTCDASLLAAHFSEEPESLTAEKFRALTLLTDVACALIQASARGMAADKEA